MPRKGYVYKVVGRVRGSITYGFNVAAVDRNEAITIAEAYIGDHAIIWDASKKQAGGKPVEVLLTERERA